MIAKQEVWTYPAEVKVWAGKYKNSHNLLHWHYDCEFLYVEKGSIDVFCEKKKHSLSRGDALFIDSEQVHYMSATEQDTTLIVIVFDYSVIKPYLGNIRLLSPKLEHTYPVTEIYKKLGDVLLNKKTFYGAIAAGIILEFAATIFQAEKVTSRAPVDSTSETFKKLLEEIADKCEYYTFDDAVNFMTMSPAYFSRYFKKVSGITFSDYLNHARTERAVRLLKNQRDLSMTEISLKCGFGTIRNFNRIFKAYTGYSPKLLPENFVFSDQSFYPSKAEFNPTLYDCELIESGE